MKIEKLKPGMTVYSVGRHKMGNTTMSTVSVWEVRIASVNIEEGIVYASWNGNPVRSFHSNIWSKWRAMPPVLIRSSMGYSRLATREEIAAIKMKEKGNVR